ncbi:hypothetical protein SAMN04488057_102412 [Cyclobacterium lianum]|uniref:Uncharacterized protein n=1 Tax=Cyclobacterium lianum TaxID=388280 RepID=A0A1M7KE10_9BACT|nr:hypothetical protein [Cyclobacterium lianum]SHM63548.1 hypothetical protein SAMN04488057_102412 [Cyclobacterium lianum]
MEHLLSVNHIYFNLITKLLLSYLPVLLFLGCSLNEPDPNCNITEPVPFEALEMDDVRCMLQNIDENEEETSLIIENRDDFENFISCNGEITEIDFEDFFILAGRTSLPVCGRLKNQEVSLNCGKIGYHIEIGKLVCHKPTDVFYFAVIPIAYREFPIEFRITKNE